MSSPALPRRPRLHRSFAIIRVPDSDDIQLQSEARLLRLKPRDESRLIGDLLPLLDGTRTIDELTASLSGYPAAEVVSSLEALVEARLVEEGDEPTVSPAHEAQVRLFSHFSNDPHRLQAMLTDARVTVLGAGMVAAALRRSLADSGAGAPAETLSAESDLLVLALDQPDPEEMDRVNTACIGAGRTWMPVGLRGWEGWIGPTVFPRRTACHTCHDLRAKANLLHYEPFRLYEQQVRAGLRLPETGTLPQFAPIIAHLAAIEVVRLLTRFSEPTTCGRLYTIDFSLGESHFHEVLKLPRCPSCGEPSRERPLTRPWSD